METRTLFNPAFLVLVLHEAARGHRQEADAPLPFPLAFLAIALATHDQVVETLPRSVRTSMLAWINDHPFARVQIPSRARDLVPATREALRLGLDTDALIMGKAGELSHGSLKQGAKEISVLRKEANLKGAFLVGRWLGKVDDPVTSLSVWGLTV